MAHPLPPYSSSDDLKYIQKYKDLKQKVKDIELDNDKLQIKVLKTKKNIKRLRIERAILYERLSAMPVPTEASSQPSQHQQDSAQPPSYPPYPLYSPDPQLHVARRQPDPQELPPPVFPHEVHPPIHADKECHPLDLSQRPYPGPDVYPPDAHFSHARPPSPNRLHPPPPPHMPFDVDRQPPKARRQQTGQPHPGPSREGGRSVPLPASLPPPPNTLGLPPAYPTVRHAPNMTHSPHFERDERVPDAAYPHYPTPPAHRGRDRDHERAQLNGPGLPPMRTHPDAHVHSPRATSSPSHNGYAHPLPHPFSASDDRQWDRDHPSYAVRDRERDREPNGYRDSTGPPPRRYDASHGNGSAQASPSTPYLTARRSSLGHARADPASSRGQEREAYEPREREYPPYEYARQPERAGPEGSGGEGGRGGVYEHTRRRSVAETEGERAHEHRVQKLRPSQDGVDERRQVRRERKHSGAEKDRQDIVPRVREGELME